MASRDGAEFEARLECNLDILRALVASRKSRELFLPCVNHALQCQTCNENVPWNKLIAILMTASSQEAADKTVFGVKPVQDGDSNVLSACAQSDVFLASAPFCLVNYYLEEHSNKFQISAALYIASRQRRNKALVDVLLNHAAKCSRCIRNLDWDGADSMLRAEGKEWSARLLIEVRPKNKRKAPDVLAEIDSPEGTLLVNDVLNSRTTGQDGPAHFSRSYRQVWIFFFGCLQNDSILFGAVLKVDVNVNVA